MFKFHDVEQNSAEWFQLRSGRVTSSRLGEVMANYGRAFGAPAKRYAKQLAIEQLTGLASTNGVHCANFDRGHAEEPAARSLYEIETFSKVTNGGFFCDDFAGCSPDGLVGTDGITEFKSAIASVHYDRVATGYFDLTYKWQLLGTLKFTGRKWVDFVSYCSDYPWGKRLYVYRLWADQFGNEFEMIDLRVAEFEQLVRDVKDSISQAQYIRMEREKCS